MLKDLTRTEKHRTQKSSLREPQLSLIVNRQDRQNRHNSNNYRPLVEPMIEYTSQKVQQLIKSLSQEGHIDSMTEKWLFLTPNPPSTLVFTDLHTYIHRPTLVGRLIISRCDTQQNSFHHLLIDSLSL